MKKWDLLSPDQLETETWGGIPNGSESCPVSLLFSIN